MSQKQSDKPLTEEGIRKIIADALKPKKSTPKIAQANPALVKALQRISGKY